MTTIAMEMQPLERRILHQDTRQVAVYGVGIAFIVFTVTIMVIRLYVRIFIVRGLGLDDIFMLIGTIFTFGLSAASIVSAYYGVGMWTSQISDDDYTPMLQAVYSTRLLYVVAMFFVKISLLVFYLRLDQRPTMRWTVYVLIFSVAGFSIASFFILAFSCYPPTMFWDMSGTVRGKCIDTASQQHFYDANGIINIILDVAIYLTPMPTLWNIQISLRSKIALTFVFGMGFLSVAAGCVRFAYVRLLSGEKEIYYYLADSLNWCSVEIYLAIFCGSASAFKILLATHFPRIFGSRSGRESSTNNIPSGQFALKTFGGSPMDIKNKENGQHSTHVYNNRGDGFAHFDDNNSKEAIIGTDTGGVVTKREVWQDVSDGDSDNVIHTI